MLELLLCLGWNASAGFVLVRLQEGDSLSPVTMSENNRLVKCL